LEREVVMAAGEGSSVENPVGGILTFKVTSDSSDGSLTAIETIAAPGEGPPLHIHDEDELIYTVEGIFRIKLGDTLYSVLPRSLVFIPHGTAHAWQNIDTDPACFLATIMPASASFERFFTRYAQLPPRERGLQAFARLAAETQAFQVVGPPLAESDPL
jgi:quercetin dioxygenase-like cupin family protein